MVVPLTVKAKYIENFLKGFAILDAFKNIPDSYKEI